MTYTYQQLKDLWISAGGNPAAADVAAAAATAESSGNPDATGPVGEKGLWQIALSHGSLATYDPLGNARAAIQLSSGGTNWRPWCTAYTDGACGTKGGVYDPTGNSPIGRALGGRGSVPAGGGTPGGSVIPASLTNPLSGTVLDLSVWWHFVDVALNNLIYGLMVFGGGVMIVIGLIAMARDAPAALTATGDVAGIARRVVWG
jgi:hypothetical protein